MSPPGGIAIDTATAASLAVERQILGADNGLPRGAEGIAEAIERLGYIQIDSICVVERAHHLTLRSRCRDYRPGMLDHLHREAKRVFEYWGHAASYLPMSDYRFYLPLMNSFRDPSNRWFRERLEKHGHLMDGILERIRFEGPMGARDFTTDSGRRTGWWDWKPAKTALELLFWRGDLMVSHREGFHRIYDLTERVLPGDVRTDTPEPDELGRFLVRRALSAYGTATEREVREHIGAGGRRLVGPALAEMVTRGEVVPVTVDGVQGSFALGELLENRASGSPSDILRLLSPFDNLIIQRGRARRLFGFDYSLECYVPASKRVHGYFVMPMLHRGRLIGRLDPKADRKLKVLLVRSLSFEERVDVTPDVLDHLARELSDFARFNGCREVRFEDAVPPKVRRELRRRLVDRSDE